MNILIPIIAGAAFVAVLGGAFWWVISSGRVDDAAAQVRREKSDDADRAATLKLIEKWRAGR